MKVTPLHDRLIVQRLAFTCDAEETFVDAKPDDLAYDYPYDGFVMLSPAEYRAMNERIAKAETRAEAQRRSRLARAMPPVAMESNPLEAA